MDNIHGVKITESPFSHRKKIAVLLEFEGDEVLTHYQDDLGFEQFSFLVDYEGELRRYLTWRLSKDQLYSYLHRACSLKEVLFSDPSSYLFLLDYIVDGQFAGGYMLNIPNVDVGYIPSDDSFYDYNIPESYGSYFNENIIKKSDFYLNSMQARSIEFGIKAKSAKFGDTVSPKDITDLLSGITKSYNEYSYYSFFEQFKNTTSDAAKLIKTFKELKKEKQLRVTDVHFASFHVSLSTDTLTRDQDLDPKFNAWANGIMESFKSDVLDNGFENPSDANAIVEKFPDASVRRKIFEPIIKIIENQNISLEIQSNDKKFHRAFRAIGKTSKDIIIHEENQLPTSSSPKKKIIQTYIEVDEDESIGEKALSAKMLKESVLFSQDTNQFPYVLEKAHQEGLVLEFSYPLRLVVHLEDGKYTIEYMPLDISVSAANKYDLEVELEREIVRRYNEFLEDDVSAQVADEMRRVVKTARPEDARDLPF